MSSWQRSAVRFQFSGTAHPFWKDRKSRLIVAVLAIICASPSNHSACADFATSAFPGRPSDRPEPIFGSFGDRSDSQSMRDPFLTDESAWNLDHRTDNMTSIPTAAEKIPNVVRVVVENGNELSLGSGTLVGVNEEYGFVVTNWHVVDGATERNCFVDFPDGFRSGATVMKTDEQWDLALLLIWKPNATPMPLSPGLPQKGEPLMIAGYGQGPFRTQAGQLTEYVAPNESAPFEMIEVSATARQGDSGGPIINQRGELAAVLFGSGGGRTTGTHVDRLRQFLDSAFAPVQPVAENQQLAAKPPSNPLPEQTALHEPVAELPEPPITNPQPVMDMQASPKVHVELPPGAMAESVAVASIPVPSTTMSASNANVDEMNRASLAALHDIPIARNPLGYPVAGDRPNPNEWRNPHPLGFAANQFGNTTNRTGSSPIGFFAILGFFAAAFILLPR